MIPSKLKKVSPWVLLGGILFSAPLWAAASVPLSQSVTQQAVARPLVLLLVLIGLSLVPFVVMMTTSFVKIAVVLALVRNAMGTQQIPPNPIVTGLAMILTIYIMIPVGLQIYESTGDVISRGTNQAVMSEASVSMLLEGIQKGKEPVRAFLVKHAHTKERALFYSLAKKMQPEPYADKIRDDDFVILIPSFVISELTEAFQIGFIIFLPFLVIDLVVTNVLLSLGMFQISPITISLPFKLLLFVIVDGWYLIAKGLIMGYM